MADSTVVALCGVAIVLINAASNVLIVLIRAIYGTRGQTNGQALNPDVKAG